MSKTVLEQYQHQIENLLKNVPRGTFLSIYEYANYLISWNSKMDLVSNSETIENLLRRHILDSLQLCTLIQENNNFIIDLGTGAGFPGMVLALAGKKKVFLTESNVKKISFLRYIKAMLKVEVDIYHGDYSKISDLKVDYFISRAVTTTSNLINAVNNIISDNSIFLLHKSKKQYNELEELSNQYSFELQVHKNLFNNEGVIFEISKLVRL